MTEEKTNNTTKDSNKEPLSETVKSVLWALLFVILVRAFLYEPFHIPSGSMKPGLLEGDYILVSKFEYGYSRYTIPFGIPLIQERILDYNQPKRGDVVVFRLPSNPRINYIKRLIGLPNDKIKIENDILYINGEEIKREYIDEYFDEKNMIYLQQYKENWGEKQKVNVLQNNKLVVREGDGEFIVPEGHYFFMGDNRDNSLDSRFIETGFVPYKNIIGKAKVIFFSKNDSLFKVWKLHKIIRFNRIFKVIR